jgi:NAD+ kinase
VPSERVIVVAKRSAYSKFVEEDRDPRVRELLKRADPLVRRWKEAHAELRDAVDLVVDSLAQFGVEPWVVHGPQVAFDARDARLVVTVGGDGTLLAASHHVDSVPVLGVNSAPGHSIGFFCAAQRSDVRKQLGEALADRLPRVQLARMQVTMDGQVVSRRVLNEALFCHAIPAATSRYIVRWERRSEEQRSSGMWVGTAAGSTGALRSAGGRILPLSSRELQLVVREPYRPEGRPYRWERVRVEAGQTLSVKNKMQDARLFLDGPFKRVDVRLASVLAFSISDEPLTLLGVRARRRRAAPSETI